MHLDYNVSSLPNFLFSFFGFRFRRELDNIQEKMSKRYELLDPDSISMPHSANNLSTLEEFELDFSQVRDKL